MDDSLEALVVLWEFTILLIKYLKKESENKKRRPLFGLKIKNHEKFHAFFKHKTFVVLFLSLYNFAKPHQRLQFALLL